MSEETDIVALLLEPDWHDPACPFHPHCYCGEGDALPPHDRVRHPHAERAASEILRLRGEVERLSRREADLLAANNAYLARAREAEAVLGDLLKFASGVETTVAYPTFQRARAILSAAPPSKDTAGG